jgi:ubiquitin carboxyl-terminal hydrolase 5/13
MEDLVAQGYVDKARVATAHDAVYNTECCYTFFNDDLLVNLNTFAGTTAAFATPGSLNVRIVRVRREKTISPPVAPTKLAIGVEGGFDVDKYETVTTYSVVVVGNDPRRSTGSTATSMMASTASAAPFLVDLPYTDDTKSSFPDRIQQSVESIIRHAGVGLQQQVQAWQADDDEIPVSKYANATTALPFVDNGVKIDPNPSTWKCQKTGATENLWLNLSDGYIGGGRKHWDVRSVFISTAPH